MYTFIIADDEAQVRSAVAQTIDFESLGFKLVGEASNGLEALELVERLNPDLVLTDIKMPYMSGIELARSVREIHPSTAIAFLTGYDDFTYAQQAIRYNIMCYMLKPITPSELITQMKEIKSKLDSRLNDLLNTPSTTIERVLSLMPLVLDSNSEVEDCTKVLKNLGLLDGNDSAFTVVMTTAVQSKNGEERSIEARVNFVDNIIKKYLRHSAFFVGGKVVSIITGSQRNLDKYLKIAVKEISESAASLLGSTVVIGLSSYHAKPNLNQAYNEALTASGYNFFDEDAKFITDYERTDASFQQTNEFGRKLEQLLKTGKEEDIEEFIKSKSGEFKQEDYTFIALHTIMATYRAVMTVTDEPPPPEIFSEGLALELKTNISESVLKNEIALICKKVKKYLQDIRRTSTESLCDQAINLIEERYGDYELSLSSASAILHCSVPYLSTIIKKNKGDTFVNLLTKKRMEKANELLGQTNLKIYDIALRCGYNDQHYFSYCFKKYFGVSPAKMREEK